ncbi:MAG TPA: hypothetical protein VGV58_23915 [Bosea sp. (in: a-proteobacteria)]|nr:hypothetical protein [Bosea sp. (in: a-proteobacteria)]HEV2512629.1 hypothetical protein [Bosea sp. (in: a-proteobacteria)]
MFEDDELAEVAAAREFIVGGFRLVEGEAPVVDRLDAVLDEEGVHRLELLGRADIDAVDCAVDLLKTNEIRARPETCEDADLGNVPRGCERAQRTVEGVRPAELQDMLDAEPIGQFAHRDVPVRRRAVVHRCEGAERLADPAFRSRLKDKLGIDMFESAITNHRTDLLIDLDRLRDASQLLGTLTVSALLYDAHSGQGDEIAAPQTLTELRTQRNETAAAAT